MKSYQGTKTVMLTLMHLYLKCSVLLFRAEKIAKLCTVMGLKHDRDPDRSYELTNDNVTKMLAIYMRFR